MIERTIDELISQRRRQILVHSVIYYKLNDNIVSDATWSKWAEELETLQKEFPDVAKRCCYAKAFEGFDHSTGCDLPLDDEWANSKARQLLMWR